MIDGESSMQPEGWVYTTLGLILSDIQSGFASGKHTSDGVGLPHFRPMNVTRDGRVDRSDLRSVVPELADRPSRRLRRGDVLFNNTNSIDLVGKTALFDEGDEPAFSNHMTRLRVKVAAADPAFVARLLHGRWQMGDFRRLANNHVSQASVSRAVLENLSIALPPLAEQHRIVKRLDEIARRRVSIAAHLQAARTALERYRSAVLFAACSGRLTEGWRAAQEGLDSPSQRLEERRTDASFKGGVRLLAPGGREFPGLPDGWGLARVGEVARVMLGGTPSRKQPAYWQGDVLWVSSGEVANRRIQSTREKISKAGLENSNAKLYQPGTVLIAMIGEGKTRGQSAILDCPAATNQNAAGLDVDREFLDPEFVWRWARAEYESTRAAGRGGNQPALNGQKVRELIIPVPTLEEQAEIVRRVDVVLTMVDRLLGQVNGAQGTLDRLSRASLARAFRGDPAEVNRAVSPRPPASL